METKRKRINSFECAIGVALIIVGTAVMAVGSSEVMQPPSSNVVIQFALRPAAEDTPSNVAVSFMLTPAAEDATPPRRSGGGAPRDSDDDGISDIEEMLAGTDKADPCSPNPKHPMCKPTPTPQPVNTPTPAPTTPSLEESTPVPALAHTPAQMPADEEEASRKTLIVIATVFILVMLGTAAIVVWWYRR